MLKSTLVKGLTTLNSQLFRNSSLKNYFQITSNKAIFSNNRNNLNIFLTGKRFFSTQEANNNPNTDSNSTDNGKTNKTDLVLKEKKKKKKSLKSKTEEGKRSEKAEAKNETADKPTAESQENAEGEANAETENVRTEKEKVFKYSKEEQKQIKKQAYKTRVKEAINLKDMYQIRSSKLGAVNPRQFFDFTKFKYPNVSVKVFDRATFTADEKLDSKSLTPVSPKLGPYVVS